MTDAVAAHVRAYQTMLTISLTAAGDVAYALTCSCATGRPRGVSQLDQAIAELEEHVRAHSETLGQRALPRHRAATSPDAPPVFTRPPLEVIIDRARGIDVSRETEGP